ncbi:flagellar biosynthesis protein FliQ [Limnobacter parvus]|uniref:Flagellar biosynthetic protein FliQ n=1 Tax=Limnobacter parvus TaxID=2939690 RepID=A0ABT1XDU7_9BURK|nr:flagellar biosynthesis protein FliQ [Limnobacter parvus]MCR2745450.1 flagellar biosynthesis protein FliQ [Limnobacter parvus]
MNSQTVLNLGQNALEVMLIVSGPLLVVALVVGLLVSILQAATQINEMTLSFIPKILGIFATLLLLGPWMLSTLVDYTQRLIMNIPNVIG